ncbi:hypothetical protein HN588_04335 [Candidatus Bathyarchaeota archaeon]|jgi:hypothetical protein|nr:hypothetical protein [Candidatus Bathyarchaeota archaeon]
MRIAYGYLYRLYCMAAIPLLAIATKAADGQGTFLQMGESGVGINGGFELLDDGSAFGVGIGYSVIGVLDMGVEVAKGNIDDKELGTDISFTALSPSLGVHVLKQSEEVPISFYIEGGYLKGTYSADFLDELDWDVTASGWGIGGSVFGRIPLSPEAELIPMIGIAHASTEVEIKDRFGDSVSNDDASTSFDVGVSFAFKLPPKTILFISPGLNFGEESTTFGVDIGFVFNTTPKKKSRRTTSRKYGLTPPPLEEPKRREWHRSPVDPPESRDPETQESTAASQVESVDGEQVPEATLLMMSEGVPVLTTINAMDLGSEQLSAIAQAFKVPPSSIKTFRWGKSAAPAGHPHAGSFWYRIEYGEEAYHATEMIRIGPLGGIIKRTKE